MSQLSLALFLTCAAFALSVTPLSSQTNKDPCAILDQIVADQSVEKLKTAFASYDRWTTNFLVEGFDRCIVLSTPEEGNAELASTETIECHVWTVGISEARKLRDQGLETLTCGNESISLPGLSISFQSLPEEGRTLFFPRNGVAIGSEIQTRGLDFSLWRRELRENDPRTTAYEYKVVVSIQAVFPKQ